MAKTCIICSAPAGSVEHTFPAVFGGRRVNRGIYCNHHNNAFGRHVAALLSSLDIVNATVGVVPDRRSEVRPAPAVAKDGERFFFSKSSVSMAPPLPLVETPEFVGKPVEMRFANAEQATKWVNQQEKAGYVVNVGATGPVQTQIVASTLTATRELGAEPFMRGVAYLAVTFLAHAFPELARSQSLASARELIEKDGLVGDSVWWEPPETAEQRSPNPFNLGHSIVIGPDREMQRICALVSFYDGLHLGVDLGAFTGADSLDQRFTTHIDPLASHPPHDVVESRENEQFLTLSTREAARKFVSLIRTGQVANPLAVVMKAAVEAELKETSSALLPEVLAAQSLTGYEREIRVFELLSKHHQRIFNLMIEGVQDLRSNLDLPAQVHSIFEALIAADYRAPRGISAASEVALAAATNALCKRIRELLEEGDLDVVSLADLLGGKDGYGIILRALTDIVAQFLPEEPASKSSETSSQ